MANVSRGLRRWSMRGVPIGARMAMIAGLSIVAVAGVGAVAWHAVDLAAAVTAEVSRLNRAQVLQQDADMMHDSIKADVFALLAGEPGIAGRQGRLEALRASAGRLRGNLDGLKAFTFSPELAGVVADTGRLAETYIASAQNVATLATQDRAAALVAAGGFEVTFERMLAAMAAQTQLIGTEVVLMERQSYIAAEEAKDRIVLAGLAALLVASVLAAAIGRSIHASLRQISGVAQALAAGNLDARSDVVSRDALGTLSQSINRMAQHLQDTLARMRTDLERAAFGNQLVEALDLAPSESQAHAVVASAMFVISSRHGMELLVEDAGRQRLERATEHPSEGAPGCGVERHADCVAVRRGTAIAFADSEAVNACPRLRGRTAGRVTAVCVPVTCVGRSIGVLHAAGPVAEPLVAQQAAQLALLAGQAGARIGAIRGDHRASGMATRDGVASLLNRRTLAREMRTVIPSDNLLPTPVLPGGLPG